ncbi:MAG TPA: hypothetical protein VLR49_02330 [Ferruginibacter sp.]|nr:hypothetical protein [Ferruginibacter sp.]
MRKLLTLTIALLLIINISYAQLLNKVLPASPFSTSLSTVVENYQNNYVQIQGGELPADDDRDIYLSTVSLPGSSLCVIYRFHSKQDTTASWQATLYNGEDFKEATKVYKHAFKQMKQTTFKVGMNQVSFDGSMENPSESLRFTTSILRPSLHTDIYKNFIAEIEMLNSIEGWIVRLNLHSRKEDTERYQ